MRWLLVGLTALLLLLQYRLWLASGGISEAVRLQTQIEAERARNAELAARNALLEQQILELQQGTSVIEQRAREDLGLIKDGEVYFQFAEDRTPRDKES